MIISSLQLLKKITGFQPWFCCVHTRFIYNLIPDHILKLQDFKLHIFVCLTLINDSLMPRNQKPVLLTFALC